MWPLVATSHKLSSEGGSLGKTLVGLQSHGALQIVLSKLKGILLWFTPKVCIYILHLNHD
jgi:hypothetical protein